MEREGKGRKKGRGKVKDIERVEGERVRESVKGRREQ